jgi:hypothetical protein
MPMLDLGDWPNCSMAVPAHRILATMLYPRVEEHAQRQELQTALDAEQIFSMDCVEQARLCTTEPERVFTLLRERHNGKAAASIFAAAQRRVTLGAQAGAILWLVIQMSTSGVRRSLRTACGVLTEIAFTAPEAPTQNPPPQAQATTQMEQLIEKWRAEKWRADRRKRGKAPRTLHRDSLGLTIFTGFYPITFRTWKKLHEDAWLPYKDVAPLWTAHNVMRNQLVQPGANGFGLLSSSHYADPDAFLAFLALADWCRHGGGNFIPHAQKKALLTPETTWRVPNSYGASDTDGCLSSSFVPTVPGDPCAL